MFWFSVYIVDYEYMICYIVWINISQVWWYSLVLILLCKCKLNTCMQKIGLKFSGLLGCENNKTSRGTWEKIQNCEIFLVDMGRPQNFRILDNTGIPGNEHVQKIDAISSFSISKQIYLSILYFCHINWKFKL